MDRFSKKDNHYVSDPKGAFKKEYDVYVQITPEELAQLDGPVVDRYSRVGDRYVSDATGTFKSESGMFSPIKPEELKALEDARLGVVSSSVRYSERL
jgi:hypothetical protein